MAVIPPFNLASIPNDDVASHLANAKQRVSEQFPEIDPDDAGFESLVLSPLARMLASRDLQLQAYLEARSPLAVSTANAQLVDPESVDHLLSNFNIERQGGSLASGSIRITVDRNTTVVIGSGSVFTSGGNSYVATGVFTAKKEPAQVTEETGDRLFRAEGDGRYSFVVDVEATSAADNTTLRKGQRVTPVRPPLGFVSATVESDFSAGLASETNAQALERLRSGAVASAPSTPDGFASLLNTDTTLQSAVRGSVAGFGDPEMRRDKHPATGMSAGGRVDWDVRGSRPYLQTTADVVGTRNSNGTWTISISETVSPGFYDVSSVVSSSGSEMVIESDTRGFSGNGSETQISTVQDAAYSSYQTATLVVSGAANVSTSTDTFTLTFRRVPLIKAAQDLVLKEEYRSVFGDVLVKAPVPCFVSVAVLLETDNPSWTLDTIGQESIEAAASNAIESTGFTGRLLASTVQQAVWPALPDGVRIQDVQVVGRVRMPDSGYEYLVDARGDRVEVPTEWLDRGVGPRNVQFFADGVGLSLTVIN